MLNTIHMFAGGGGAHLAGNILGWNPPLASVEWNPYAMRVLAAHASPGEYLHDDVRTFGATRYRGHVDLITGGFPCQDLSVAGNQEGLSDGTRSSLYKQMLRVMEETDAPFAFFENVEALLGQDKGHAFKTFLTDLQHCGYAATWCVVRATDVGLPHERARVWVLAYQRKLALPPASLAIPSPPSPALPAQPQWGWEPPRLAPAREKHRRDRLSILGNAWVPAAAARAFMECVRFMHTVEGVPFEAGIISPEAAREGEAAGAGPGRKIYWPRCGRLLNGRVTAFPPVSLPPNLPKGTLWPTPTVNDAKNDGGPSQRVDRRHSPNVNGILEGPPNADWVEALMGWPVGGTRV